MSGLGLLLVLRVIAGVQGRQRTAIAGALAVVEDSGEPRGASGLTVLLIACRACGNVCDDKPMCGRNWALLRGC